MDIVTSIILHDGIGRTRVLVFFSLFFFLNSAKYFIQECTGGGAKPNILQVTGNIYIKINRK